MRAHSQAISLTSGVPQTSRLLPPSHQAALDAIEAEFFPPFECGYWRRARIGRRDESSLWTPDLYGAVLRSWGIVL